MTREAQLCTDDVIEILPTFLLRWEEPQQAHVLLYPEGVVKLNVSAAEILKEVGDDRSVGAIITELSARYGGADVGPDVIEFLEIAYAKGWIRTKP
jgi:pyrroloquinoline quinone biosynthesis protein D